MGEQVPKALKDKRNSMNDAKWESLKQRGIEPPATEEERIQRLKDSHGF